MSLTYPGVAMSDNQVKSWPAEVNDIPPTPNAVRVQVTNPNNSLPEGTHAGCWKVDNAGVVEYWKPTDVRPFANSALRYESQELDALKMMSGHFGFPQNWWVVKAHDRTWIVRNEALVIPDHVSGKELSPSVVKKLESSLREFNKVGWEIGDHIRIAIDDYDRPFFLDLSAAGHVGRWAEDDQDRFYKWCELNEHSWLSIRRQACKHLVCSVEFMQKYGREVYGGHVYLSHNRPLSTLWMTAPDCKFAIIQAEYSSGGSPLPLTRNRMESTMDRVHSLMVTESRLSSNYLDRYELTWGWSPLKIEEKS